LVVDESVEGGRNARDEEALGVGRPGAVTIRLTDVVMRAREL
jgi:hypothetical protein